ncbi:MAG: disulfide bond formation protein B, partial [Pseudomonadota bacterium]
MFATGRYPLLILAASAASLLGAFAFQYIGGLQPCVLCVYQRYPHGVVIG